MGVSAKTRERLRAAIARRKAIGLPVCGQLRSKIPNEPDLLRRLYVERELSTIEIGRIFGTEPAAVRRRLVKIGVARRSAHPRSRTVCRIDGCGQPVEKRRHTTSGGIYGGRCEEHRKQAARIAAQRYEARQA